jgi:hypothetical protein
MTLPSPTTLEAGRLALAAALTAAAAQTPDMPVPARNEGLDVGLVVTGRPGKGVKAWLNIVDADPRPLTELLGADDDGETEMEGIVRLELIVQAVDSERREAAFDRMIKAIGAALRADRTLGGACDDLTVSALRLTSLALEGMAQLKAGEITIALLHTAPDLLA